MIHLNVLYYGFSVDICNSFCCNSAKPQSARALKSIKQRQEVNGIFKDFRKISFLQ